MNIRSKSGAAKVLGTIVCLCGAMLLTLYKGIPLTNISNSRVDTARMHITDHVNLLNPNKKTESWTIGTIALVAGSLVWSSWFLIQARISKSYPCQYSSTTIMCFFGAIQSALLSLVINRDFSSWILKGKLQILSILYAVNILIYYIFKNIFVVKK